MNLERLLLKEEEISIRKGANGNSIMLVPIYPALVDPKTEVDRKIADDVFPEARRKFKKESGLEIPKIKPNIDFMKNGFAKSLTLTGKHELQFDEREYSFFPQFVNFDGEKLYEYCRNKKSLKDGGIAEGFAYILEDVGYPASKFYRTWAMLYLNEAMRQTLKE